MVLNRRMLESACSIQDVLQEAGVRNRAVSGRLKHHIGYSPKTYMSHHRLCIALQLIRETKLPFTSIAFLVGFNSEAALAMATRRFIKQPPTQVRLEADLPPSVR